MGAVYVLPETRPKPRGRFKQLIEGYPFLHLYFEFVLDF